MHNVQLAMPPFSRRVCTAAAGFEDPRRLGGGRGGGHKGDADRASSSAAHDADTQRVPPGRCFLKKQTPRVYSTRSGEELFYCQSIIVFLTAKRDRIYRTLSQVSSLKSFHTGPQTDRLRETRRRRERRAVVDNYTGTIR